MLQVVVLVLAPVLGQALVPVWALGSVPVLHPVYTGIPFLGETKDRFRKPHLRTQCFHPLVL